MSFLNAYDITPRRQNIFMTNQVPYIPAYLLNTLNGVGLIFASQPVSGVDTVLIANAAGANMSVYKPSNNTMQPVSAARASNMYQAFGVYNPRTKTFFSGNPIGLTVTVSDPIGNAVITNIPTPFGDTPVSFALNQSNGLIYFATDLGHISEIDPATNTILRTITANTSAMRNMARNLFGGLYGSSATKDVGNIPIPPFTLDNILYSSPTNIEASVRVDGFVFIAVDALSVANPCVYKINLAGQVVQTWAGFTGAFSIDYSAKTNCVYVGDSAGGNVVALDVVSMQVQQTFIPSRYVMVEPNANKLYLTDPVANGGSINVYQL